VAVVTKFDTAPDTHRCERTMKLPRSEFDYVIVGAGSAGCVLAYRLSADPGVSVLLVEAGDLDRNLLIGIPKGMAKLVRSPRHTWAFPVHQPRRSGLPAPEIWVRGKGLGGSSSVNGMIYSRGHRADYEEWAAHAGDDWGWLAMREAYRAIEDHELGANPHRGQGGLVHVSTGKLRYPVAEAMIAAGEQIGLVRREDLNDPELEGVGYYNHNIRRGRRQSAARTFLAAARHRRNLTVRTGVNVHRVLFDGRQATGIATSVDGILADFHARREVILSAGAIMSPVILQRSGIGPKAVLDRAGVPCSVEREDCGRRMREHLGFSMPHRLLGTPGLNRRLRGIGLIGSLLQYYTSGTGPMATGPYEVGAFMRSMSGANRPDTQLYLGAFTFARSKDNFPVSLAHADRAPGLTIYGQLLNLTSEGSVEIVSANPDSPPRITPNWLATDYDRKAMVAMVRSMRTFVRQPALAPFVGEELVPGPACQTDDEILEAVTRLSTSGLHGVATCRMGKDDGAVVDASLRVRGVQGLRVADCSVMPSLVSGNTNAPAMALGWRASDIILRG
jgi:choline dehydrogenase-like flavoprotein